MKPPTLATMSFEEAMNAEIPRAPVTVASRRSTGVVLVSIGGARWLTNEVEKMLLRTAASIAASRKADPNTAIGMANANSRKALELAEAMPTQ